METKIEEFKQVLLSTVNNSELPLGVKELILESLLSAVRVARAQALEVEQSVMQEQETAQEETSTE